MKQMQPNASKITSIKFKPFTKILTFSTLQLNHIVQYKYYRWNTLNLCETTHQITHTGRDCV